MSEPCKGCNEDKSHRFREGKIPLRFIREKKKPKGAMRHYKDGEIYLKAARNAQLPWWEPVDKIDFPIVEPATEKDSVFQPESLDDPNAPAYLGPSGIELKPGIGPTGVFVEPSAPAEIISPPLPQAEEEKPADFTVASPSDEWTKKRLLDFIKSKGGVGKMEMRKSWLLEIAISLA